MKRSSSTDEGGLRPHSSSVKHRTRARYALAALVPLLAVSSWASIGAASARVVSTSLPALPRTWPTDRFAIGMADGPGDAATLRRAAPFAFRYQYLSGGVNTGSGWTTWNPDGTFVTRYDDESFAADITPVFSYYMLLQSLPTGTDEGVVDLAHLQNPSLMRAYWSQVRLFFRRARGSRPVVLQVEPDLWGYLEQANAVVLARSFARELVALRNALAPNVLLAYHMSEWGTGHDAFTGNPSDATVRSYAARSAAFYRSLGTHFDIAFTDLSDRDAGYYEHVEHRNTWFSAQDFAHAALYDATFVRLAGVRLVVWQVPLGNTVMRSENDTWDHYQDNRVQWYLGTNWRAHLGPLVKAGVIALLFGRGADGNTCACDAAHDGVTNPPPIDGNVGIATSPDDDGGYFKSRVALFYKAGGLALLPT